MKKLENELMEKMLNESAWKELSEKFPWTEQMLEKYKNRVDWKEISGNSEMVWTPTMLGKFRPLIDWHKLSNTSCETILTETCLEQYMDYWDWAELSDNDSLKLSYRLIDKFVDRWDWSGLINHWAGDDIYGLDFLERYADKIPSNKLRDSRLWNALLEERTLALKLEVIG